MRFLRLGTFLWFVLARFSANLEFESLLTRGPSRITFGARNVEFYSQLILTNPYEVRLATSLSGDKEFQNRKPE